MSAVSWRVTAVWILSPGTGPVSVPFTEDFLDAGATAGATAVDRVEYICTLASVTPGP